MTTLFKLLILFGSLSLLAIGGGKAVLPQMQHAAVETEHWMTNRQFLEMFAITRVTPGPDSLIVALIGQQAAGLRGALIATLAMYLPSSVLVYLSAKFWGRARETKGRANLEKIFATLGVGLVLASSIALLQALEHSVLLVAITLLSTLIFYAFWDASPLLIMLMFGAAGIFLRV